MVFNIADLLEAVVDAVPEDRVAVVAGDRRLTYREFDARANRFAHFLRAQGIGPGDHVGLHLFNGGEFLEAMVGAFKVRAVPININYRYVADELRYLFRDADVKAIVHQAEFTPVIEEARADVPTLRLLVSVADDSGEDASRIGARDYEKALAASSPARGFPPRSPDDVYMIYTGGTTGMPKGVMWRHEDVFFAGLQGGNPGGVPVETPEGLAEMVRNAPMALTYMPAAPFIHGAAQWAALIGMFGGGKVVILPGRSYNARRICELIEEERVNTLTLVGDAMARPLAEALAEKPVDSSSLIVIASAGAILSDSVKAELASRLPTTMIINGFGATETGHQGNAMGEGAGEARRPSFFMDGSSMVVDENMKPVAPGSGVVGKLARKGRIPLGYYKDPAKTAATFFTVNGERWVMPGDMAIVEEDGRITVLGRGSVCINSGGEKVFPEEVEAALKGHPAVQDAVVVGVPDARWGERVAALVQPRAGARPTLEELAEHCRRHVAGYKVPREVHLIDQIARHPSGKPDYRWAKARAMGQA